LRQLGICILVNLPHSVDVMLAQFVDRHVIVAMLRAFAVRCTPRNALLRFIVDLVVIVIIIGLIAQPATLLVPGRDATTAAHRTGSRAAMTLVFFFFFFFFFFLFFGLDVAKRPNRQEGGGISAAIGHAHQFAVDHFLMTGATIDGAGLTDLRTVKFVHAGSRGITPTGVWMALLVTHHPVVVLIGAGDFIALLHARCRRSD
jgi:hypothetical protein